MITTLRIWISPNLIFNNAYFNNAYFNNAYFNNAYFNNAYFNNAYFNNAYFNNAYFNNAYFIGTQLLGDMIWSKKPGMSDSVIPVCNTWVNEKCLFSQWLMRVMCTNPI